MACPIHSLSDLIIANDSEDQSERCAMCLQLEDYEHPQYSDVYDHVPVDDNAEQSFDEIYWPSTEREYDGTPEPTDQGEDRDSTEACRASDDTSSTDAQALYTPTSSSDRFGTYASYHQLACSLDDRVAISWDGTETDSVDQTLHTYSMNNFLASESSWSTYNRRIEQPQDAARDSDLNDDSEDRVIDPSYSG